VAVSLANRQVGTGRGWLGAGDSPTPHADMALSRCTPRAWYLFFHSATADRPAACLRLPVDYPTEGRQGISTFPPRLSGGHGFWVSLTTTLQDNPITYTASSDLTLVNQTWGAPPTIPSRAFSLLAFFCHSTPLQRTAAPLPTATAGALGGVHCCRTNNGTVTTYAALSRSPIISHRCDRTDCVAIPPGRGGHGLDATKGCLSLEGR